MRPGYPAVRILFVFGIVMGDGADPNRCLFPLDPAVETAYASPCVSFCQRTGRLLTGNQQAPGLFMGAETPPARFPPALANRFTFPHFSYLSEVFYARYSFFDH